MTRESKFLAEETENTKASEAEACGQGGLCAAPSESGKEKQVEDQDGGVCRGLETFVFWVGWEMTGEKWQLLSPPKNYENVHPSVGIPYFLSWAGLAHKPKIPLEDLRACVNVDSIDLRLFSESCRVLTRCRKVRTTCTKISKQLSQIALEIHWFLKKWFCWKQF